MKVVCIVCCMLWISFVVQKSVDISVGSTVDGSHKLKSPYSFYNRVQKMARSLQKLPLIGTIDLHVQILWIRIISN